MQVRSLASAIVNDGDLHGLVACLVDRKGRDDMADDCCGLAQLSAELKAVEESYLGQHERCRTHTLESRSITADLTLHLDHVVEVVPTSDAAQAVRAGDTIVRINRQP